MHGDEIVTVCKVCVVTRAGLPSHDLNDSRDLTSVARVDKGDDGCGDDDDDDDGIACIENLHATDWVCRLEQTPKDIPSSLSESEESDMSSPFQDRRRRLFCTLPFAKHC